MTATVFPYFPAKSWFERVKQVLSSKPQDKRQLITLLRDAQQRNLFSTETLDMIEGALKVSEKHVRDVMIPRAQMVVLELHAPPDQLVKTIVESGHSRFPVIGENRDDVQGIFLAKDLLDYYASEKSENFNMRDVMRPPVFIPESKRLNVLLREFRTSRNHMAVIVDEYSGVAGLITIEDVIEEIVGEIDDEYDIDDQVFIKPAHDGFYTVLALTPMAEFNEYFKSDLSDEGFDTISGLLLQAFGHLPKRGEKIELGGFHFEVIRANARRIQLLRTSQSS
ncbi:MAG: magnesium/cobalt efflux protein [Gammaproteobacteria bacterium]|nr:MAG: magnesium/cobalt efflux protein [Gammaproteobacteria bacterium]RKZ44229.1 MAG: magnesium/cobalt efflux protein [Gammaproteobacteria bacterium]RKZ75239.1 MAG: magnesium/cobalt efflux protein [Gammaproteobacteria bacterium]